MGKWEMSGFYKVDHFPNSFLCSTKHIETHWSCKDAFFFSLRSLTYLSYEKEELSFWDSGLPYLPSVCRTSTIRQLPLSSCLLFLFQAWGMVESQVPFNKERRLHPQQLRGQGQHLRDWRVSPWLMAIQLLLHSAFHCLFTCASSLPSLPSLPQHLRNVKMSSQVVLQGHNQEGCRTTASGAREQCGSFSYQRKRDFKRWVNDWRPWRRLDRDLGTLPRHGT